MSALKNLARAGLHKAGGLHMVRRLHRGFRILTYHRFRREDVDLLERQCRYLRRHYLPVSLGQIACAFRDGNPLALNAVAVTVDDGYRDFLDHAAPVLKTYKIPATIFLVASFIDREQWLWWDLLAYSLARTTRTNLETTPGNTPLIPGTENAAAFNLCVEQLKGLPNRMRIAALADILKQLDVPLPAEIPAEMAPLTWEEIRALRKQDIEFGGHTVTHPILSRVETSDELAHEVSSCKLRIERALGEPVLHFSYPNGLARDWNEAVVRAVETAGYATAVTTVHGINRPNDSPFLLKRIAVDPDLPFEYFTELLAGLHADANRDA